MSTCARCKKSLGDTQKRERREIVSPEGVCQFIYVCESCAAEIDNANRPTRYVVAAVALAITMVMAALIVTGQVPGLPSWLTGSEAPEERRVSKDQTVVTVAATQIYAAADLQAEVVKSVPAGYKLKVLEYHGDWLKGAGAEDAAVVGFVQAKAVR